MTQSPRNDELTPISQLGRALSFSYDDLRTNRAGGVTRRQQRMLWQRFWGGAFIFIILLIVPIAVSWVLVAWGTTQSLTSVVFDDTTTIGYLIGIMAGMLYLMTAMRNFLLAADLVRGKVRSITGPVERYGRYLYVGQERYLLQAGTLELVQSELHYTLYFLPVSQYILSLEFAE
jgi:hypothetical protein